MSSRSKAIPAAASAAHRRLRRGARRTGGSGGGLPVAISGWLTHGSPAMSTRLLPLIALLTVLPALTGCGSSESAPPPAALSPAALAAVVIQPDVSRAVLARRIDALFADRKAGDTQALLVLHGGRIVA